MQSSNGIIPVRAAIRIRPLSRKELKEGCEDAVSVIDGKQIYVESTKNAFTYDFAFGQDVNQEEVYHRAAKDLIPQLFKGYNVTILAYGQTGSGKTHTMGTTNTPSTSEELLGIIPRAIKDIYEQISSEDFKRFSFVTKVSFIELYKENLYDLLSNKSQKKEDCSLDIREDPKIGLHVSNLTEVPVESLSETIIQLENGSKKRVTAATAMNNVSSRSHAIFTFHIEGSDSDNSEVLVAKFHLVDLAGSERQKKTKATGERLKEGIDINKGLLALGNVIAALGEEMSSSSYKHIPYRDSKLTRLLQDSLGGNSHTLMIACSSPSDSNLDETISTLRYADRARKIKNKPIVNREGKDVEINKLKNEISTLRAQLEEHGKGISDCASSSSQRDLQNSLDELRKENSELASALMAAQEEITHLHEGLLVSESRNEKFKKEISQFYEEIKQKLPQCEECNQIHAKASRLIQDQEELDKAIIEEKSIGLSSSQQIESDEEKGETTTTAEELDEFASINETEASIALRHNGLATMVQSISKNIVAKEKLASMMSYNEEKFNEMKDKYNTCIKAMEDEISKLSAEKEDLLNASRRDSNTLSEQRKKKVQELENLIKDLKRKIDEQQRTIKINEKNKSKISTLSSEILQMKQQKIKLIRQMKEDSAKIKIWKEQKERELAKVKLSERKTICKISKMETLHCKQINVWKRKVEETAAINARLKSIVDKQKNPRSSRSSIGLAGLGGKIRALVEDEIEILVGYKEAVQTRENFLKERTTLTSQMNRCRKELKRSTCPDECKKLENEISNLKKEIQVRSSEISSLQRYVTDLDKCKSGLPTQLESLQSMTETKLAIEFLFEKCADALATLSHTRCVNKDLVSQVDYFSGLCSAQDKEISEIKSNHDDAIVQLSSEHEEKIRFLLKQLPGLRGSNESNIEGGDEIFKSQVSDIRKMSKLNEALFKIKDENVRLKLELENKKFSNCLQKEQSSNVSISSSESNSDDENPPEWKKTPLFARIRSLKRQSLANVHNSSYNSGKKKLDPMLEELNSDISDDENCSEGKVMKLNAHSGCKCQNDCNETSGDCTCRSDDKTCGDCCCLPHVCSNRNRFLKVPPSNPLEQKFNFLATSSPSINKNDVYTF